MKIFLLILCLLYSACSTQNPPKSNQSEATDTLPSKKVAQNKSADTSSLDELDQKMALCLRNIEKTVIEERRREMKRAHPNVEIICVRSRWPPNSNIWSFDEYPTTAYCVQAKQLSFAKEENAKLKNEPPSLTEKEKQTKLADCKQYLEKLELSR
ncbi:MAG: hypothetical protein OXJ52_00580 [Oligoflexia bacterium]|nr:hypothetical protein [Oligoflexia bacterium]